MTTEASQTLDLLNKLSGNDFSNVLAAYEQAKMLFDTIDRECQDYLGKVSDGQLAAQLSSNLPWLTEAASGIESIFVYCDISSVMRVLALIARIRSIVHSLIGSDCVRFVPLSTQHTTLFTASQGAADNQAVQAVYDEYCDRLARLPAFNVMLEGPHLAKDGGIIIEVHAHNCAVIDFKSDLQRSGPAGCVANPFFFSTVGYILHASRNEMMRLWDAFRIERMNIIRSFARVRHLRISGARNRLNIGDPQVVEICGYPRHMWGDDEAAKMMAALVDSASTWLGKAALSGIVFDQAWQHCERPEGAQARRASEDLILRCIAEGFY